MIIKQLMQLEKRCKHCVSDSSDYHANYAGKGILFPSMDLTLAL